MLTDQERAVLGVESRFWRHAGVKEDHVRESLGLTPVRYYQVVNALIERSEAWEYAPATVSRLRALRGRQRMRARSADALG